MVALHAATGAATGALTRSRIAALVAGPVLHVAGDRVPHRHPSHPGWEYLAGVVAIGMLAERRGLLDAATLGAASAVVPDVEHLIPGLRLRGAKVLHRRPGRDRRDGTGLSIGTQTLLAASILAPLLLPGRRRQTPSLARPGQARPVVPIPAGATPPS
jgi:hypothetical protein